MVLVPAGEFTVGSSTGDADEQPAHQKRLLANVDWADALAHYKWAGKRLLTEAEREKAVRGMMTALISWATIL